MDIKKDKANVEAILEATDNMTTASVCHMYLELFEHHRAGKIIDKTRDNFDREDSHNIAGSMNSPSEIQTEAFNKEISDDSTEH